MTHSQTIGTIFQTIVSNMTVYGAPILDPVDGQPITDLDGNDITWTRPVPFAFGYWPEISNGLLRMGVDKSLDGLKYPLIVMHSSIIEHRGTAQRYLAEIDCKFVLIAETKPNYSTLDRIANIYEPVLYPLYASFLDALSSSHLLDLSQKDNLGQIKHDKQDLFYMGSELKNQNQLSDIVDAIELTFKNLKIRKFTY